LNRSILRIGLILMSLGVLVIGCTQPKLYSETLVTSSTTLAEATSVPSPSPTSTLLPTPVPICSPLNDVPLSELQKYVSNPFAPVVRLGSSEGGHHGTDFAYYTHPVTKKPMLGSSIHSVFSGRVASVSSDRLPYGNLIIIETPLTDLPAEVVSLFGEFPQPTPSVAGPHANCPVMGELPAEWDVAHPSLYLLYAHMALPADYQIGDQVSCGQVIGQVGTTGTSIIPHLHLEMRYGPGGASFESLAFYSVDDTAEERAAYCIWRMGGNFQMIDPMRVLETGY
jgi:murein DD-endopeptidase MepM/ murein hydrolase activator NlpD